jgi:hypothetical protein
MKRIKEDIGFVVSAFVFATAVRTLSAWQRLRS